jgi:riboflavin kinase/FMN adenylyltransferase
MMSNTSGIGPHSDVISKSLLPPISGAPVIRYPAALPETARGGVCTVGNFDGLHTGHWHVIERMRDLASRKPCHLVSFYPHPAQVLRGGEAPPKITPIRLKAALLARGGISHLYLLHFTLKLAQMSAEEFIGEIFVARLGISHLVVGEDAAVGHGRRGNVSFLKQYLPQFGIGLTVVENFLLDGIRPSSRAIRTAIQQGQVASACNLLGRYHTVIGRVIHGDGRGKQMGTPTANVAFGDVLLPPNGVYACAVRVKGIVYPAVTNIGIRPTFGGVERRVEAHILSTCQDSESLQLYGARMGVAFVQRLRDEVKFDSIAALTRQIEQDKEAARAVLAPLLMPHS